MTRDQGHGHPANTWPVPAILTTAACPAPPTYTAQRAGPPKWKANFTRDILPHTVAAKAIPGNGLRNMRVCYTDIWTITNTTPLVRIDRLQTGPAGTGATPAVAPAPPRQRSWDDGIRQSHKAWINSIRPPAECMTGAERAEIIAECANYAPQFMAAGTTAVTIADLTAALMLPLLNRRGAFIDRLPEFLCQLGSVRSYTEFI